MTRKTLAGPLWLSLSLLLSTHASAGVVINEIFYHAPDDLEELQWIELHNPDTTPANISGWRFTSGVEFRFPADSIVPAGGYVLVCRNIALFADYYDAVVVGQFTKSLAHNGDTLILVDSSGKVVDRVKYGDRDSWPSSADGVSSSLERISPNSSGDDVNNWSASPLPEDMVRPSGTPGKVNASYSANLPPVISRLELDPRKPLPGKPIRVQANVEDGDGVANVELLYCIAKPGEVGDEKSITMSSKDGRTFSGELPGFADHELIRIRIRAIDKKKTVRHLPSTNELRPAVSLFVASPAADANIALAYMVNTDPREMAEMEQLRRRAQSVEAPSGRAEQFQLMQMLSMGLNVPEAWFEWTINQSLNQATYQKLRDVFIAKNAERNRIIEETLTADDLATELRTTPARIRTFNKSLAEQVKGVLPEENVEAFQKWQEKFTADRLPGPADFVGRLINIEGAWLGVNSRVEFTVEQLEKIRPTMQAAIKNRADAAGKIIRREISSFEKFQELVGSIEKNLDEEMRRLFTVRQQRALVEWRSAQGSPIRPRLADVRPRSPRGRSAFIAISPKSGEIEVFDFVHITERSAGYRVRFHRDHLWNEMSSAAVIFEYNDRFVLAEPLAFDLYRRVGNAACQTDFVRLTMNGHLVGYHLVIEQVNSAFLRRNHLDPSGDLFKILWYRSGIEGQHEKQNHPDHNYDELKKLITLLESIKGNEQWEVIQKNFNVEQVVNYFAVNMVLSHWDGFFNNYFTFHDRDHSGKWEMYPWDQDKTWGFHDSSGATVFYDMPVTFGMEGDRPPGGGEPVFNGNSWWRAGGFFSKPLLANAEFRKRYLLRVRQILEETYNEKEYFPIIDAMATRLRPEVAIRAEAMREDPAKADARLDRNVASLKEHLVKRRKFLLEQDEIAKVAP